MENWHIPELNILEKKLNTDLFDGLSAREARERLEKQTKRQGGRVRSLFVPRSRSVWSSILSFATSPFTVLLLLMSLLTAIFGRGLLGALVFAVALAAAIFGGIVSLRAQRRLDKMREYASPMVRVKRGGNLFHTDGRNLVVGDVIVLGVGDLLPCDARIIKCDTLFVDELVANKERDGILRRRVMKHSDTEYDAENCATAPNATNMLYAGSAVVKGSALALVVAVGGDVYLSEFVSDGALGGKDGEPEAVKSLKPIVTRISFLSASGLLLLSLLGFLTLNGKEEFICYFTMLLSAIFLITGEILSFLGKEIFSSYITRLSRTKSEKRKKDNSAAIRNVKALDKLTEVTDLVLFGTSGLYEGVFKVGSAYISGNAVDELVTNGHDSEILLSYINTYVKAQRDGGGDSDFNLDGITEALYAHLRSYGFDFSGAALATKSLYFANDIKTGYGFACAETESSIYRVLLTFDEKAIKLCDRIRIDGEVREINSEDLNKIKAFSREADQNNSRCILCISESDGKTVFEGAVTIYQTADKEIESVVKDMARFGITTTVFLPREDVQTVRLVTSAEFKRIFTKNAAFASDFHKNCKGITDEMGAYSAYIGFSAAEYSELVSAMRDKGCRIVSLGVSNEFNEVMAKTDIVATCDVIRYSSEKYRESVYERMPAEGRDTNVRASQQTRLLSKVIVRKSYENGGGIYSLFKAIRMSRGAYVSVAQSILLFTLLSATLLTFCAMSVISGNILLDPLQTVSFAAVFAFLSATVFSDSEQRLDVISANRDFTKYPYMLLKASLPVIISRVLVAFVTALTVKILDAFGVFGEAPAYTLPIYICLLLTMCVEVFIINMKHTKKGEGRSYCWLKVVIAYAILLGICSISTQDPFISEFFKNGFGSFEYLIIPGYLLLYGIALLVSRLIGKSRNNI